MTNLLPCLDWDDSDVEAYEDAYLGNDEFLAECDEFPDENDIEDGIF